MDETKAWLCFAAGVGILLLVLIIGLTIYHTNEANHKHELELARIGSQHACRCHEHCIPKPEDP